MSFVLDCSLAIAWCFKDETTQPVRDAMDRVSEVGAIVPNLWRLEVGNALRTGMRRGQLTSSERDALMERFSEMAISVDPDTDRRVWPEAIRLSDLHGLTVYDACYLELALRRRLPLASLDRALCDAACREAVPVIGT